MSGARRWGPERIGAEVDAALGAHGPAVETARMIALQCPEHFPTDSCAGGFARRTVACNMYCTVCEGSGLSPGVHERFGIPQACGACRGTGLRREAPREEPESAGTGPGDAGSQKIYEKLAAQQQAGAEAWDVDVAVVHQKMAGQMVEEDLLDQYREEIETGKLVTSDTAEKALGTDVGGFVMPMFHSQTAIAYNADLVPEPPGS